MSVGLVRALQAQDLHAYVRMRSALWPEADREELAQEVAARLTDSDTPAFVAERPAGGLCGFIEASIRPWAEGIEEQPCAFVQGLEERSRNVYFRKKR